MGGILVLTVTLPGKNPEDRDRRDVSSLGGGALKMGLRETMGGRNPSSRT